VGGRAFGSSCQLYCTIVLIYHVPFSSLLPMHDAKSCVPFSILLYSCSVLLSDQTKAVVGVGHLVGCAATFIASTDILYVFPPLMSEQSEENIVCVFYISFHSFSYGGFFSSKPPPLPEELQDWKYLPLELFRKPWDHSAPFLKTYGYILAHTPEYDSDPRVETAPRKPPKDSFHPADDEDFVYRLSLPDERKRLAQEGFFQQVNTELTFRTLCSHFTLLG
jgi:hypothetical protein